MHGLPPQVLVTDFVSCLASIERMRAVYFGLLGPLEARNAEGPIPIAGGRQRALLGLLLLRGGETVSIDRVIDELWGSSPPPTAAKSVHVAVAKLRKALGEGILVTHGHGYSIKLEPNQLDVTVFERLVEE